MISIILNTWNHYRITRERLPAMIESVGAEYEVLIHDQASKDGADRFGREYATKWFRSDRNIGNPAGLNFLLAESTERYIAKIDPDFIMPDDWGRKAIEVLEQNPDVGLVGYYWARGLNHPDLQKGMPEKRGEHIIFETEKVFGVWIFRRELIDIVGGFDESYVYGNWDTEFNQRVKDAGFKRVYMREDALHVGQDTEAERRLKNYLRGRKNPITNTHFDAEQFRYNSEAILGS